MGIDRRLAHSTGEGFNAKGLVEVHFQRIFLDDSDGEIDVAASSGIEFSPVNDQGRFLVLPSSDWVALPGETHDEFKSRIVADLDLADKGGHIAYLRSSLVC